MPEINKPSDINKIWASAGDVLAPSDSKIATGWQVEIPSRQYFNYIDWKQDAAIAHINQHGIPVWDNVTEYQYSLSGTKSICMGSDGTIYRAKQVNVNQNPVADVSNTYWEVAFADISQVWTKTQSDGRYLQKSNNLSDLTNTVSARANLSVYSQTEVDGKTTIASTAQSQAWTSDGVLLSPLKLAQAFQGANRQLATSGYQKIPGGLILQWGRVNLPTAGTTIFSLPTTFPNACLYAGASLSDSVTYAWSGNPACAVRINSTSALEVQSLYTASNSVVTLIAIGY